MKGILFTLLFLYTHSTYAAPMYQWTDENGQTHYGDTPPVHSTTVKRLRKSELPHVHSSKPPVPNTGRRQAPTQKANIIKASRDQKLCRYYRGKLISTEKRINNRSLDQNRDHLWSLKNKFTKKVREYCD